MATLLDGVNRVLRRVQIITSDLATFTSAGKQPWIDTCVYAWNEAVIDMYGTSNIALPLSIDNDSITLVVNTRNYTLATDLIRLRYPFKDETNGQFITEYPGGFLQMQEDEIFINDFTGLPYQGAIDPTNGEFYLDYIPDADSDGRIYQYWYDKNLELSNVDDVFPFNNHVFLSLVPAVAETWKRENKMTFDEKTYTRWIGNASKFLIQKQQNSSYLPLRAPEPALFDPYE